MPFNIGQRVRMRVTTIGTDDSGEERTYPVGALGIVYMVEQDRRIYHVEIGEGDRSIANSFDFGEEAEVSMEAVT